MNKDVINVAAEDDITDIISKIRSSSQKIIAIVPPAPAGVLRSAVNIKLIIRTAEQLHKVIVLVTEDPALLKLAMQANLPVAANLQTRPSVPTMEDLNAIAADPDKEAAIAEEFIKAPRPSEEIIESSDVEKEITGSETDDSEKNPFKEESRNASKRNSKSEKEPGKFGKKFPGLWRNRKLIAIGGISAVAIAAFCVWAFVIAPFVEIDVSIRTTATNFSENVSFTTKESDADSSTGKFYLKSEKVTEEIKTTFTATGKKDIGDKASGSVIVSVYFTSAGSISIPENTSFIYGDNTYLATADTSIKYENFGDLSFCENSSASILAGEGCEITASVPIAAAEPGDKYNLDAGKSDWDTSLKATARSTEGVRAVSVYNPEAISGGTSKIVTVVSQSDVDSARSNFVAANEQKLKERLKTELENSKVYILDSTYKTTTTDPVLSVKVDEQVADGVTPTITSSATISVYTVSLSSIEDFINRRVTVADSQKIYSIGDPFVEHISEITDGYTGKMKTTYQIGPKITESDIIERVAGRKIGEVKSLLEANVDGVSDVNVKRSYFWVNIVPNDPMKISVNLEIEG